MRIVFIDSYYDELLKRAEPLLSGIPYRERLQKLLDLRFGTSDFASDGMRSVGWESADIIANCRTLQERWRLENGLDPKASELRTLCDQVDKIKPDVVCVQNIGYVTRETLGWFKSRGCVLVGMCSYKIADSVPLEMYDVIFTSFPHYLDWYGKRTRMEYLPLAFGEKSIEGLGEPKRDIDVSFIGGMGHRHIWDASTDVFEHLATHVPKFVWWGYGVEHLPDGWALKKAWRGEAWGREMYRIYLRSKIVVNRHGEIARGFANNMRLFEATGSGACLVTESAPNIWTPLSKPDVRAIFSAGELGEGEIVTYSDRNDLVWKVRYLLENEGAILRPTAERGRKATLSRHTFRCRSKDMDRILRPLVRRVE